MDKKRPNVLILMTDSQRYDTIAAAGYPYMITPNLDRLSKDGVIFRNAISSNPQCMPARMDLITGLTGKFHGYNLNSHEPIKDKAIPTLPGIFAENQYRTAGIGKMHFRPERTHHGYDHIEFMEDIPVCRPNDDYCLWLKRNGLESIQNVQGIRTFLYNLPQESLMEEAYHPNTYVATRAIEWLDENGDNPFFLMCSWTQPHPPLMIPEYYRELYNNKNSESNEITEMNLSENSTGNPTRKSEENSADNTIEIQTNNPREYKEKLPLPLPIQGQEGEYRDIDSDGVEFNREIRKSYYGSITMIDKNIGRILDWLEAKGELDNTLIFFTSDHGEMLGDGGSWFKDWPYEGSVRIPFILRYPEKFKSGISDRFVDLLDIMPTCLDVCGLEYKSEKYSLAGTSILNAEVRKIHTFAHGTLDGYFRRYVCARNERYKYVYYYNGEEECYDLDADPAEIDNLIGTGRIDEVIYADLKNAVDDYEKLNFPDGEYDGKNHVMAAHQQKAKRRLQMSKYWMVFHYYRFWNGTPQERKERFVKEFYDVLKPYDTKDIFRRIKKAYSNLSPFDDKEMKDTWQQYCGELFAWETLEEGLK